VFEMQIRNVAEAIRGRVALRRSEGADRVMRIIG
jgi:hypothetical protein